KVRCIVQEIDHYFVPAALPILRQVFTKKPEERDAKVMADARDALRGELARLEDTIVDGFLAGSISAADFVLYPHVALVKRVGVKEPGASLDADIGPKLGAWANLIESLPFFDKT